MISEPIKTAPPTVIVRLCRQCRVKTHLQLVAPITVEAADRLPGKQVMEVEKAIDCDCWCHKK